MVVLTGNVQNGVVGILGIKKIDQMGLPLQLFLHLRQLALSRCCEEGLLGLLSNSREVLMEKENYCIEMNE